MTITLDNIGKRYHREWIFRHVSLEFLAGNFYAIIGPNGSGKSTLLQIVAGNLLSSEGKIYYRLPPSSPFLHASMTDSFISPDEIFRYVSMCTPYLHLIEELTLRELLAFHQQFKPFPPRHTANDVIELMQLHHASHKPLRQYSSGMKQRVKLGLALISCSSLVVLDEPLTNLDNDGINWFYSILSMYGNGKIVLIGANRQEEHAVCHHKIDILLYKT